MQCKQYQQGEEIAKLMVLLPFPQYIKYIKIPNQLFVSDFMTAKPFYARIQTELKLCVHLSNLGFKPPTYGSGLALYLY